MDENQSTVQIFKSALTWGSIAFVSLVTWIGKRQIDRIDVVEKRYISRDEHKKDNDEIHKKIESGFNRIYDKLDDIKK